MKLIWHLFLFNLKFHRMRLVFLSLISLGILGGCTYFYNDLNERGSTIVQYCLYVMFMVFTMRMNARGNFSLSVKHMLALPMTHREIVLSQSIADIAFYFPVSFVILYGFYLVKPEYHILLVGLIFHIVLVAANIISFNKRIDLGRMQHTKASFKNSFVYVKKYLDTIIQIAITLMIVTLITVGFSTNITIQEYAFMVLGVIVTFIVFSRTVKMLQDETQSYFLFNRDIKTVVFKMALVAIPMFATFSIVKNVDEKKLMRQVAAHTTGNEYVENITDKVEDFSVKVDEQKLFLAISKNDEHGLNLYLETHEKMPLDQEVLGSYLPHIAAKSNNIVALKAMYRQDPKSMNKPGHYRKTSPLQVALKACHLETVDFLMNHGANLNHQNIDGDYPLLTAAKNHCHGGVILLSEKGAKFDLKNKDGEDIIKYLSNNGLKYIIEKKYNRNIASETESEADQKNTDQP